MAAVDRLVAEALARTARHPQQPTTEPGRDPRHVRVHDPLAAYEATVRVEAELDLADARDLDHALPRGAEARRALGSEAPLDVRRAQALGDLARHQPPSTSPPTSSPSRTARARVVLHVQLAATVTGRGEVHLDRLADLEEGQRQVLLDQVSTGAPPATPGSRSAPSSTSPPASAPGYAVPTGSASRSSTVTALASSPGAAARPAAARSTTSRPTTRRPDPTAAPRNLAALCTFHHRLKTHGGWSYTTLGPGDSLWRSPHGHHYLRDHTGTSTPPAPRHRPRP